MAGAPQYNFPPPPPPPGPPPANHPQQHPQYGYAQQPPQYQQQQQPQRGGGAPRGGRGGHQSGPYNPQQPGLYNGPPQGPPQHQGPPQGQGPPNGYPGPNGQPAPYIGPQAPGPQGPPNHQGPPSGYPGPPQWQNNQQHGPPQHHGPPQQQQPPPLQVAPLSTSNYHPNYAPQIYQQPQYGAQQQQPPQFQSQPTYGHSVPPHQPPHGGPPQQWNGPPQQARPPFNSNRGRGGFANVRGGHEAPLMGPPIRMGFDNERGGHMAQAGNGFPQQYPPHQPPPQFSQPPYQPYPPPQEYSGQRPSLDPNPYNSGPNRGGRGGHGNNNNFRGRNGGGGGNRGDFQQFRGRDNRQRGDHSNSRAPSENFHKQPAGAEGNGKKKKKRRTNTLGLTPNGVEHEDSDEEVDDVDEEARLVTLLGPDTPQLPTDLEEWLAERRSRFPTKARREAAAEELRQRREQNRQNKQKDHGVKKEEGETKLEKQQRKAEKLRRELEKTERKIQAEASGAKRKRENADEGDEERGQGSDESDSSSGSDSDEAPEAASSRSNGPIRVSQPAKAQLQRHCKYFSTGGTCGKKGKCRFVHDQEVRNQALREKEANGGKMTLAQRLILNDTAKDDLTILKSIKYLKEKGLMPDQLTSSVGNERYKSEESGFVENLHYDT